MQAASLPKKALIAAVQKCDILFCLLHDRIDRDVIAANPKLRLDRGAIDLAVQHRRRGGDGAAASRHRGSAGHHRGDRRSHVRADARGRAADDGRRPPRAGGKVSRRAVELPARLLRLGQDHRPRRRRRADRPGGGAARARLLHARALLDAAAQAREPGTRGRPDLRSARSAARRIRFRLAAFAAQRRRRATRSGRASSS